MVAFVLEFLRGLMPLHPLSSPPVATVCSFDSFQSLHRHRRPLSPLSSTFYHLSLTLYGRGKFSRSGNLSGKVWLFNFLAAVCQRIPPPYSRRGNVHLGWTFFFLPCQPSYRVTLMTVELCFPRTDYRRADWSAREGTLSFTSNFSISRNFCYR